MTELPPIAGPAELVDIGVTVVAIIRTDNDYAEGKISRTREWVLNGTGLLGLINVGPWGLAFSIINGMATGSGAPP